MDKVQADAELRKAIAIRNDRTREILSKEIELRNSDTPNNLLLQQYAQEMDILRSYNLSDSVILLAISESKSLRWNVSSISNSLPDIKLTNNRFNNLLEQSLANIFRLVIVNDHGVFYCDGRAMTKEEVCTILRDYANKLQGVAKNEN